MSDNKKRLYKNFVCSKQRINFTWNFYQLFRRKFATNGPQTGIVERTHGTPPFGPWLRAWSHILQTSEKDLTKFSCRRKMSANNARSQNNFWKILGKYLKKCKESHPAFGLEITFLGSPKWPNLERSQEKCGKILGKVLRMWPLESASLTDGCWRESLTMSFIIIIIIVGADTANWLVIQGPCHWQQEIQPSSFISLSPSVCLPLDQQETTFRLNLGRVFCVEVTTLGNFTFWLNLSYFAVFTQWNWLGSWVCAPMSQPYPMIPYL